MLDATWPATAGPEGLEDALDRLGAEALEASRGGAEVVVLTDAAADLAEGRLPVPSVLASGAVHTALAEAGLRGRTDLALDAGDVLDVHGLAMVVAAGARVVHPRLLFELVREQAGSRGAEQVTREAAIANVLTALDAGLRKVLARMGISTVASYVGGQLFETLELGPDLVARCFPAAAAWPGRLEAADLATVQLQRLEDARALAAAARPDRLPDPGFARFRGDGEFHLYSPSNASALETLAATGAADPTADVDAALATYRAALHREGALVRDGFRVRRPRSASPVPLEEVEDARSIARRFVVSAMSVGALSPEAHRVAHARASRPSAAPRTPARAARTRRGTRPARTAEPTDSKIKQVASARFGVTAEYLARADQLEIKMAQGSKPGEGGQLPGRKVTAYIASLRRAQPGQALISPPPHHDIYSIEDLAQLIADLRAINPTARIGVKLVATRGVGTIASGVTKAGADYIHLSGHAGGTGASPLSSIKHVGAPWELGLSEVHQSLLRNDLRNRVALRTDGGLQTGDDLLIAALLGAEEFALRHRRARRRRLRHGPPVPPRHLPDGHRHPARGPAGQVHRHAPRWSSRSSCASPRTCGGRSPRSAPGPSARSSARAGGTCARRPGSTIDLSALLSPAWTADAERRATPWAASRGIERQAASGLESRLVAAFDGQAGGLSATGLRVTTAERSFGAALTGAIRRGDVKAPVQAGASAAPPARASAPGRARASRSCSRARPTTTSARACPAATSSSGRHPRWSPAPPWPPPDPRRSRSRATRASTARPAVGSTSSGGPGCGSRSATRAPRRSSRGSARTAAST